MMPCTLRSLLWCHRCHKKGNYDGSSVKVTETQVKQGLHTGYVNAATVEDTFRCSDIPPKCRRTAMVSERC